MATVRSQRQRLGPQDRRQIERLVEVWKQFAGASRFPFQRVAEPSHIDSDEQQVVDPGKVPGGGLAELYAGGKMDVPVVSVDF